MTNYNEKLDGVLNQLVSKTADASYGEWQVVGLPEAKQAIISLIEELVAEAKPLLKERTALTEFTTWDRKTKVVKTFESETDPGFNKAIDQFEQNLLKELEEK